jgi:acyl-CoA thioesterase-2
MSATTLRKSRAFETVEVLARQDADDPILQMVASFHRPEEGPTHQIPMDAVGPPQGESFEESLLRAMTPHGFDADGDSPFELPVEIRSVGGIGIFSKDVRPPQARCWLRARGAVPDDPALHQCLFAYASDYAIMAGALNPHPVSAIEMHSFSLDHAIWFHRALRMDDWLLFELDSPVAAGARAVGRGLLYTRDGELVASCVQEGLLRPQRAPVPGQGPGARS